MTLILAINIMELWNSAWPAGLTMLLLGVVFAAVLLVASEKLKVKTDPRIDDVLASLPNANCGACGFAGCAQYAKAMVENPSLMGKCGPGGPACASAIAAILNLSAPTGFAKKAIVHCRAHTGDKSFHGHYTGIQTCTSANALPPVQACGFGCLAFGDCVKVCKFDAIHIIDGLATVDYSRCTGCGACAIACPRNIIKMVPFSADPMMAVACSSKESGKVTYANCTTGCIGCGLCTKQSEYFSVANHLARVDYNNYIASDKTHAAYDKCPSGVIIEVGKNAKPPRQPKTKAAKPEPAVAQM